MKTNINKKSKRVTFFSSFSLGLLSTTIIVSILSNAVFADGTDVIDEINITVPVSCTMSGTGMTSHNADISNGTFDSAIGETTIKAYCNDNTGFSIYAIGYTDNEDGKNVLTNSTLGSTYDIVTGTATGPVNNVDTSNWAMKLSTITSPAPTYPIIIAGSESDTDKETGDLDYSSFQEVPDDYTKVAYRKASTDINPSGQNTAEGSTLKTTYQAYISKTQPAGTYSGQVKYTLVHPHDATAPIILDTGRTVNSKLKSLAATVVNGEETTITPIFDPNSDDDWYYAYDEYIKTINVHTKTTTPAGFTPSEANTIYFADSQKPIYIIFDNANDAGVMHFYTEEEQIVLPADSSFMFYLLIELTSISNISDWDTSGVIDMEAMFYGAGDSASTFTLDLSSWDTSSVVNMSCMFSSAGYSATTWSIGDLSSWKTSSVTNMGSMFSSAGHSATTWSVGDLSSWKTSSVTNMSSMFVGTGYSATTWSIGDLSSWKTSSVTNMAAMFQFAGYSTSTFSLDLSSWNTSNVTNMLAMFQSAGHSATTWSVGDLSSWNTSGVVNMSYMFSSAGYSATTFNLDLSSWDTSSVTDISYMFYDACPSATTWSITISPTNGNDINNTTSRLYGQTTSNYAAPPSGKSFTLAN